MNITQKTNKIETIKNSFRIAYGKKIKYFNKKEQYRLKKAIQLTIGFGEDKISITEPSIFTDLNKYRNIYQLDKANFLYQEKIKKKAFRLKYKKLILNGIWINLIVNKRLIYANLWSVENYILETVIEKLNSKLNKLIPNIVIIADDLFIPAKDVNYKDAFILNKDAIELRAFGRENEYKKINKRINDNITREDILSCLYKYYSIQLHNLNNSVFYNDINKSESWDIIIGQSVAKKIKFQSFLKDLDKFLQPFEIINLFIDEIYNQYKRKIFKDIL